MNSWRRRFFDIFTGLIFTTRYFQKAFRFVATKRKFSPVWILHCHHSLLFLKPMWHLNTTFSPSSMLVWWNSQVISSCLDFNSSSTSKMSHWLIVIHYTTGKWISKEFTQFNCSFCTKPDLNFRLHNVGIKMFMSPLFLTSPQALSLFNILPQQIFPPNVFSKLPIECLNTV